MSIDDCVFLPIPHRRISERLQEFTSQLGWGQLKFRVAIDGEIANGTNYPSCVCWWETTMKDCTFHVVPSGGKNHWMNNVEVMQHLNPYSEMNVIINSARGSLSVGPVYFAFSNRTQLERLAEATGPLLARRHFESRTTMKKFLASHPFADCSKADFRPTKFVVRKGNLLRMVLTSDSTH